jgi:hypothetical protein
MVKKKKLTTNADGTLNYPHKFNKGDLVEVVDDIHHIKKAYGNGLGIITSIDTENIKVYWQSNEKYMNYTIASAVLALQVISQ